MNASQSAFYDIVTIMLIVGNLIFMAIAIANYENIWLFILSLILMFMVVGLRMVKTKEELIGMCDNNHDRKVMQDSLDKHDKVMRKAYNFMFLGAAFFVVGIILINIVLAAELVIPEWIAFISIVSFMIGFGCMIYAGTIPLRSVGLI